MNCTTCKEEREPAQIPFIAHESAMARMERVIKRQWATIILLICMLLGTNVAWLWYESQYEEVTTTTTQEVTQDADNGTNNFVGGDVIGETDSQDNNNN